jgi:hypothetical protein
MPPRQADRSEWLAPLGGGQFEQFGSFVCSRFGSARSFAGGLGSSFCRAVWRQFDANGSPEVSPPRGWSATPQRL